MNYAIKREVITNIMKNWKADVVCFKETKVEGEIENIVKEVWGNKCVNYALLKGSGTKGGIVIMFGKNGVGRINYQCRDALCHL